MYNKFAVLNTEDKTIQILRTLPAAIPQRDALNLAINIIERSDPVEFVSEYKRCLGTFLRHSPREEYQTKIKDMTLRLLEAQVNYLKCDNEALLGRINELESTYAYRAKHLIKTTLHELFGFSK
jgi:hypothetical protein